MPGLRDLCRQGTDELLLEMPFYERPRAIVDTVRGLVELDDITVVLAHVDRYPPKSVEALGEAGALMQAATPKPSQITRSAVGSFPRVVEEGVGAPSR